MRKQRGRGKVAPTQGMLKQVVDLAPPRPAAVCLPCATHAQPVWQCPYPARTGTSVQPGNTGRGGGGTYHGAKHEDAARIRGALHALIQDGTAHTAHRVGRQRAGHEVVRMHNEEMALVVDRALEAAICARLKRPDHVNPVAWACHRTQGRAAHCAARPSDRVSAGPVSLRHWTHDWRGGHPRAGHHRTDAYGRVHPVAFEVDGAGR